MNYMRNYQAKVMLEEHFSLAESPFYDERTGIISFVDIPKGNLFLLDWKKMQNGSLPTKMDAVSAGCISLGQMVGAAVPMEKRGQYLLAATDGLYVVDANETKEKILDTQSIFAKNQRSNDAKSDPRGRLFFGSSVYIDGDDPGGNLFCYDNGKVSIREHNTRISNGLAWSKDETRFFFSDSLYHCIFVYDYDVESGNIANRRVLCEITDGVPDGMCIDDQDNLWIAVWGGSRIEHRDSKTGELLGVVNVPAEHTSSCCFYGENNDMLFITSSGDGLYGAHDGCVFSCQVDAHGAGTDYCKGNQFDVYKRNLQEAFEKYTAAYDLSDPKIKLKVDHTYRVAGMCEEIARSLSLSEEDVTFAWTCGMLHDIGRFEQVRRYGTFMDAKSIDHAQFGADLLFKEGLIRQMLGSYVEAWSLELIEKTIRVHNVFCLPQTLSDREKLFADILRDADKIDILRVNCETPPEEVYNVSTWELRNSEVSEKAREAFKERRCAKRDDRMSAVDYLVGHVCLVFELVFPRSKELVREQGYLSALLNFSSDNEETCKWFAYMREEMTTF
ncbi:MAG: SMP-30/gluconolactonase/LRE family protein [Lachnospiraceae bacterium]|nr:SMP-30/gluconolactonase/LRE family protein [Lachnospiraceae bacterium]